MTSRRIRCHSWATRFLISDIVTGVSMGRFSIVQLWGPLSTEVSMQSPMKICRYDTMDVLLLWEFDIFQNEAETLDLIFNLNNKVSYNCILKNTIGLGTLGFSSTQVSLSALGLGSSGDLPSLILDVVPECCPRQIVCAIWQFSWIHGSCRRTLAQLRVVCQFHLFLNWEALFIFIHALITL